VQIGGKNMFGLTGFRLYIVVAIVLFFGYKYWENSVEQAALMEYNQRQLEQTLADQKAFKEKMAAIEAKQNEILKQNEEEKKAFQLKLEGVSNYLDSTETKKNDKSSSDILRQTVNMLKDAPK
jgi:Tfp pilus assembly protein PilN